MAGSCPDGLQRQTRGYVDVNFTQKVGHEGSVFDSSNRLYSNQYNCETATRSDYFGLWSSGNRTIIEILVDAVVNPLSLLLVFLALPFCCDSMSVSLFKNLCLSRLTSFAL